VAWGVDEDDALVPVHGIAQQQGCDARFFRQQRADSPALPDGQQAWADAHVAMALLRCIHGHEHIPCPVIQPLFQEVRSRADFMAFVIGLNGIDRDVPEGNNRDVVAMQQPAARMGR
jgi:hypothetical protein